MDKRTIRGDEENVGQTQYGGDKCQQIFGYHGKARGEVGREAVFRISDQQGGGRRGGRQEYSFKYGIIAIEKDKNLENVLAQAGQSVLAQANNSSQGILQLLQ